MMPSGIQRREKFTTLPMKGTSTATKSIRLMRKMTGAYFSQIAIGICTTTKATTKAMAKDITCRCKKKPCEYAANLGLSGRATLAE